LAGRNLTRADRFTYKFMSHAEEKISRR